MLTETEKKLVLHILQCKLEDMKDHFFDSTNDPEYIRKHQDTMWELRSIIDKLTK